MPILPAADGSDGGRPRLRSVPFPLVRRVSRAYKARPLTRAGDQLSCKMERRSGVEPESSDWQTEILAVELPPRKNPGGPTENRTQRADLARISCTPAPGPREKSINERGIGAPSLSFRPDRLKPATPMRGRFGEVLPRTTTSRPNFKTSSKHKLKTPLGLSRGGVRINLAVVRIESYPVEPPTRLSRSLPN